MCTVKYADELDRRFCFEVVTPWRACMVQADSDVLRKKWVTYIEANIARALRISASNKVSPLVYVPLSLARIIVINSSRSTSRGDRYSMHTSSSVLTREPCSTTLLLGTLL